MICASKSLEEALSEFDREAVRPNVELGEEQRQRFVERFPIEHWWEMPLEEFALGQGGSEDNVCHWLEFGTVNAGSIKGGSARKPIIYKHKNKPGWYYPSDFGDEHSAWTALRDEFVRAFELAGKGQWDEIENLDLLASGPVLRLKTLYMYFPQKVLPIYASAHLKHYLRPLLDRSSEDAVGSNLQMNRRLLALLRSTPELESWRTLELAHFLYFWNHPRDARRVVKIAPGPNAKLWDDCLTGC